MINNTQHHIQVKYLNIVITIKSLVWTHNPKLQTTIPNQTDYYIHQESLIIINLWFSAASYLTTTSSFLEIDNSSSPAIAAKTNLPYSSRTYE